MAHGVSRLCACEWYVAYCVRACDHDYDVSADDYDYDVSADDYDYDVSADDYDYDVSADDYHDHDYDHDDDAFLPACRIYSQLHLRPSGRRNSVLCQGKR